MAALASVTEGLPEHTNRVAIENEMMELFAPFVAKLPLDRISDERLWRADSIHRAKNLSQLMGSLAVVSENPSRQWLSPDVAAQVRGLARAYGELAEEPNSNELVQCAPLLVDITTRLVEIFGQARGIRVQVKADRVSLRPESRRALILICSELIINSLKYGYPNKIGGLIRVRLTNQRERIVMVVEDDGVGLVSGYKPREGGSLMDDLTSLLDAILVRDVTANGHGYQVVVVVPHASVPEFPTRSVQATTLRSVN